jgi:predicted DNA-binding transcriptional regulator AlpA
MRRDEEPTGKQTVNADEFMKMLDVSPNTFKKLVVEGRLPMPLPLGTRNRRWSRSVVNSFLNQQGSYNTNNNTKL